MKRVLIANRGEIAIRVIRACRDHGLESVAIYSEEDRDALHTRSADFAFSLDGVSAKDTYLNIPKIIALAKSSGADAIHPGYGFLSENADFAQAVIDAKLIWIGPSPAAISALGDKVSARRIASAAGAPLVAGTKDPVNNADEIIAFAREHGLPVAIKAAFGGGGRGLKVARTLEEIPELFASAVREAIAGFGRGECFVERYLDKPRHVETQVLVDSFGHAVVISTRDCSLQRRHQKLVEEAPAPFLTEAQNAELYRASKASMKEAGYVGAGTCEFLIGLDGTISFLEVNTRLQVEHPVSEEITGIDLDGEVRGVLPSTDWKKAAFKKPDQQKWFDGETISLGIGQGYNAFTILQLAHGLANVLNYGVVMKPHIAKAIEDPFTRQKELTTPKESYRIDLKPENVEIIKKAMVEVNKSGTSASSFRNAPFVAGGKTGTAQVFSLNSKTYNHATTPEFLRDHALFVAYAPNDKPKIAIAMIVENSGFGAQHAAPIARKALDYYIDGKWPKEIPEWKRVP